MRLTHSLTLTPLCLLAAFILTLLTPICSLAAEQQVIQAPALGHGILRRYEARDVDIEQVIHVALVSPVSLNRVPYAIWLTCIYLYYLFHLFVAG